MPRKGDCLQTYAGLIVWPLDPRPEEIEIVDIAHALSNQCRFSGHTRDFFCPTPDQRVLTCDMDWTPAGDLRVGDELLAFDEYPTELGSAGKKRRRFRHSVVTHAVPVKRPIIRLEMADGCTVRTSSEHPWLVATKVSRNQKWLAAAEIAVDIGLGRKRYMHKFVEPWRRETSYDAGWLSGITDGEGHISISGRDGIQFGIAQRPGLVLERIDASIRSLGFQEPGRSSVGTSDVMSIQFRGGWREMMKFLGSIRPVRLLDKFTRAVRSGDMGKQLNGIADPMEIVSAYEEPADWVSGLETSTHTYFCEGFGAHNSVAQHSVNVSLICDKEDALWGLLHDAAEAYVVDLPRPLKHLPEFKHYRETEDLVMHAICDRFGLPHDMPASVHDADERCLAAEVRALMTPDRNVWARWLDGIDEWPLPICPLGPKDAERIFRNRFTELTGLRF